MVNQELLESIWSRIGAAFVCAALGLIICFGIGHWLYELPTVGYVAIPAACAVAGFAAGEMAVEVFKYLADWV